MHDVLWVGHSPSPQVAADQPSECIVCVSSNFAWFQPHCRALKRSRIQIKSILHFKTISVNVTNIDFNTSSWSALGVNISFTNCDIKCLNLKINGRKIPRNSMLHIIETQVGCMSLYDTKATLKSCTFNDITVSKRNGVCIYVSNSTIIMKSSLVANFKGASFIQVTLGRVNITNTNFVHCVPKNVLICISNQSRVSIENNTFSANHGELLFLYNASVGLVENSLFEQNKCEQPLLQVALSFIEVTNCHFLSNTVGTCLHIQNRSIALIDHSDFVNNTATYAGGIYALQGTLQMNKCIFFNNTPGGIKVADTLSMTMSSCMFHRNSAVIGGALFVIVADFQISDSSSVDNIQNTNNFHLNSNKNKTVIGRDSPAQNTKLKILIHNSTFIGNIAQEGGAIKITQRSLFMTKPVAENVNVESESFRQEMGNGTIIILDSFFGENKAAASGGAMSLSIRVEITKSTFIGNMAGAGGGAINCRSINMTKCQFERNSAHDGGALFSEGLLVHILETNFKLNTASEQGGAISIVYNGQFSCIICSFCNNTAGSR